MTQEQAAIKLEVPLRTYKSWESDSAPTPWPRHRLLLQDFLAELDRAERGEALTHDLRNRLR